MLNSQRKFTVHIDSALWIMYENQHDEFNSNSNKSVLNESKKSHIWKFKWDIMPQQICIKSLYLARAVLLLLLLDMVFIYLISLWLLEMMQSKEFAIALHGATAIIDFMNVIPYPWHLSFHRKFEFSTIFFFSIFFCCGTLKHEWEPRCTNEEQN